MTKLGFIDQQKGKGVPAKILSRAFGAVECRLGWVLAIFFGFLPLVAMGASSLGGEGGSDDFRAEAFRFLKEGRWDDALVSLRTLQKESPESEEITMALSAALFQMSRREEAISVLLRYGAGGRAAAQNRVRVFSTAYFSNASLQMVQDGLRLMRGRKIKSAREKFEKSLEAEPDNVEILLRVSQAKILEGDYETATEHLRLARKLNPYEIQVGIWLGRSFFLKGQFEEALKELKMGFAHTHETPVPSLVPIQPYAEQAAVWYAEALRSAGERGEGIRVLEQDITLHPLHAQSMLLLSDLFLESDSPRDFQFLGRAKKVLDACANGLEEYLKRRKAYYEVTPATPRNDLGFVVERPNDEFGPEIRRQQQKVEKRISNAQSD